jgi:sensor histidine kinase YesM
MQKTLKTVWSQKILISKTVNFAFPYALKAWGFAAIALVAVWLLDGGWNIWFHWLVRLLFSYSLVIAIASQLVDAFGLFGKVIAAILSAFLAALLTELVLSLSSSLSYPAQLGGMKDELISTAFSSYLLISTIMQDESNRQAKSERQMVELKLNALQAQIEPHFLYNTLANVQQLVRSTPQVADEMLQHLITYLKAAIPDVRNGRGLLGQEVDRAESYLKIMQIRMGARLQFEIKIDNDLRQIAIPPLGLLTLVENAVQHGIDRLPEGGLVTISGTKDDKKLILKVTDNGVGFGDEIGSGMGLTNLRERLDTLYGKHANLDLTHATPRGVEATLKLPLEYNLKLQTP